MFLAQYLYGNQRTKGRLSMWANAFIICGFFGHLNSEIEYIYMYIIDWTYIPVKPECTELNINMDLKKVLLLTREAHGTANTRMVRSNRITNRP